MEVNHCHIHLSTSLDQTGDVRMSSTGSVPPHISHMHSTGGDKMTTGQRARPDWEAQALAPNIWGVSDHFDRDMHQAGPLEVIL